jgi:glucose/mannose-6-phosphate isomerase
MQPRAAVVYMTIAALECAAACGAAPGLRTEIDAAGGLLTELVEEWGPGSPPDSGAKALAKRLRGSVPIVYGSGSTMAPARRWKTQLNENAEAAAFFSELPEADHNEICGYERGHERAPLAAVLLEDSDQHPRVRQRMELTCRVAEGAGLEAVRVNARGDNAVERVLSLVLLGDLVSVYIAVLEGIDPTPVAALDRLKSQLA